MHYNNCTGGAGIVHNHMLEPGTRQYITAEVVKSTQL